MDTSAKLWFISTTFSGRIKLPMYKSHLTAGEHIIGMFSLLANIYFVCYNICIVRRYGGVDDVGSAWLF